MANPNGPLIPGLIYDHLPPKHEPPSPLALVEPSLPSTVPSPQLHQQLEEPSGSVIAAKAEPIEMDSLINQCQEPEQQNFIKSIGDLTALSAAIDAFKRQYDDLQEHVEFIQKEIDSKLNGVGSIGLSSSVLPPLRIDASREATAAAERRRETLKKTDAECFCESMCSKGLRRYISTNLSDAAKLREEIPAALKLAKKPAKLVLDCIGRFYLQGTKAFVHDSPMIPARKASLLILECFLLMSGHVEIERSVRADAESAAIAWRKRLLNEGGLTKAEQPDARGLVLLIAGFGVPLKFMNDDLLDLIRQSNPVEISGALRRSPFLLPRIPGMIDGLMKRRMHTEAVELVYTFGLEDKFSVPSILTAFLRMSTETFEQAKRKTHSRLALREAAKNQLTALMSIVRCLEICNLDPAKVLPGWQIKEQMINLEKVIFELNKQIEEERSIRIMEEMALTNRLYNQGIKRARLSGMESPLPASYSPIYQNQGFPTHRDGEDISALVSSYLGPSSSVALRSSLGSSNEDVPATGLGRVLPIYEPRKDYLPPGTYSPIRVRSFSGQQSSVGLQSVYRHRPSVEGYVGLPNYSSAVNSTFNDAVQ